MTAAVVPTVDVVDVLTAQHDELRAALEVLAGAPVAGRAAAVRQLAVLLEAHEEIEARLVHPVAEKGIADGPAIAHARIVEENHADELLGRLIQLDGADPGFAGTFADFHRVLRNHLRLEEQGEFAALRLHLPAEHLIELGTQARERRLWL